jgi:hypothetical protein
MCASPGCRGRARRCRAPWRGRADHGERIDALGGKASGGAEPPPGNPLLRADDQARPSQRPGERPDRLLGPGPPGDQRQVVEVELIVQVADVDRLAGDQAPDPLRTALFACPPVSFRLPRVLFAHCADQTVEDGRIAAQGLLQGFVWEQLAALCLLDHEFGEDRVPGYVAAQHRVQADAVPRRHARLGGERGGQLRRPALAEAQGLHPVLQRRLKRGAKALGVGARLARRAPPPALGLRPALGLQGGAIARGLAVLPGEGGAGPVGLPAEVPAVDDQALLASPHPQEHLGDRRVWGVLDLGPDPAPDRVDPG